MVEESTESIEAARSRADRQFAELVRDGDMPDPRDRYRAWLRELRGQNEPAFRKALEYFDAELVPGVLDPQGDPWRAWTEYGLRLAQRLRDGSPVAIDATGRSRPADAGAPLDDLILHLPSSTRESALLVRLPARLSPAQEATVGLLVG